MKKLKLMDWANLLLMTVGGIGLGGFFVSGGFTNVVILKWLPLIVHQVVGWGLIGLAVWGLVTKFK